MSKYIVIVSPSYGGAEKRFFDIYSDLKPNVANLFLIAPSSLAEKFIADYPDRREALAGIISIPIEKWSRFGFIFQFGRLLKTLPRGSVFHYPLNCLWPMHIFRRDRVTMSVADCTTIPRIFSRNRNDVFTWVAFLFVCKIDVLSPSIFAGMRGYIRSSRMSLTPGGTYVTASKKIKADKEPFVVFVGRLVSNKGIDDLLDVLPGIWSKLAKGVPANFAFKIAGDGLLLDHVRSRVATLKELGIPITCCGHVQADHLFAQSAVLLSMQEITNYPSRVVPEAMLQSCSVIVRDTGDSRGFGDVLPGLVYCGSRLNSEELAEIIENLVDNVMNNLAFREEVREAALNRFSSTAYINYYRNLLFSGDEVDITS